MIDVVVALAAFVAGVIVDELVGKKVVYDVKVELAALEARLVAKLSPKK